MTEDFSSVTPPALPATLTAEAPSTTITVASPAFSDPNAVEFDPNNATTRAIWTAAGSPRNARFSSAVYLSSTAVSPHAGLHLRHSGWFGGVRNEYRFRIRLDEVRINKWLSDVNVNLATVTATLPADTWFVATLQAQNACLQAKLQRQDTLQWLSPAGAWQTDEEWAITVTDTDVQTGAVGISAGKNSGAGYVLHDNLEVVDLQPEGGRWPLPRRKHDHPVKSKARRAKKGKRPNAK